MNNNNPNPLRIGVMGCSSFAQRAMIPALLECPGVCLTAVASRSIEKAREVAVQFGGNAVEGYDALIARPDLDALYVPLPTGLHAEWCGKALRAGKHLLVEKSLACGLSEAEAMIDAARERNLLIFENFQFQTHRQWGVIRDHLTNGVLGDVHLVRATFGFPPLPKDNFRWNKALGGGALLDTGAYMAKASQLLLGGGLDVVGACQRMDDRTGVDLYGEAMFRDSRGRVAQVAYGFDYFYQCRVELLGTKGKLSTNRVFTAPPSFEPVIHIETAEGARDLRIPVDNHYANMWAWFAREIREGRYAPHWDNLRDQARLLDGMKGRS